MESISGPQRPTKSNLTMRKSKSSTTNTRILKDSLCKSLRPSSSQDQRLANDADGYIMKGTYNISNNAPPRGSRPSSRSGRPPSRKAEKVDSGTSKDFYTFGDPIMMSNGKLGYLNNPPNTHQENHHFPSYFQQGSVPMDFYYYPDYPCYPVNYQYPQPIFYQPYIAPNNDFAVFNGSDRANTILHVNPFGAPCYYAYDYVDENNNYCYQVGPPSSDGSYQQTETYPSINENSTTNSSSHEDCSTQTSSECGIEETTNTLTSVSNDSSENLTDNALPEQVSCSVPVE